MATGDDDPVSDVRSTLSYLRSECETCGHWSGFTGRTAVRDGRRHVIVRCPNGDGEFAVWRRDREDIVASYEWARTTLRDATSYDHAFESLTDRDADAITAVLSSPPLEMPLFAVEDVEMPPAFAGRWCELLLRWDGWRPRPARAVRIEETIATALWHDAPACVGLLTDLVRPEELGDAVLRVRRRFPHHDPSVLIPLMPLPGGSP